jgi:small subunit ribosomal protein S5
MSSKSRPHRQSRKRKEKEFQEVTLQIRRVMRVTAGGRQLRFSALVVIGDKKGRVGYGLAKANEVAEAIQKAVSQAKKNIITVKINSQGSISHPIRVKYKASKILLMPAKEGTGVIAGSFVRTVCELVGIKNIVSKSFGSKNKISGVKATLQALTQLREFTPKKA